MVLRLRIINGEDQKHITDQILQVQISAGKSSARKRKKKKSRKIKSILTSLAGFGACRLIG